MEIIYENGVMTQALTRGDGSEGEVVTQAVRTVRNLPLRLLGEGPFPVRLEVRGEMLMFRKEFEELNRLQALDKKLSPIRATRPRDCCVSSTPRSRLRGDCAFWPTARVWWSCRWGKPVGQNTANSWPLTEPMDFRPPRTAACACPRPKPRAITAK